MENTIGARIRQIRLSLKMTQKEFAESLGVTQTTISGIEKNAANTSLTLVRLISVKYGISEAWILEGTSRMENSYPESRREDKQKICELLLPALQATNNLRDLKSLHYDAEKERVIAVFATGNVKTANVAMDSGTSMIRDIISQIV